MLFSSIVIVIEYFKRTWLFLSDMKFSKGRRLLFVGASLVLVGILVSFTVVSRAELTANSAGSQLQVAGRPTHFGHPLVPVPSPSGTFNSAMSSPSSLGCTLPASECVADLNWGGYAVCVPQSNCQACLSLLSSCNANTTGTVTDVVGTWVVPAIVGASATSCSDSEKTWYDMSDWVGIDGFVSDTVEQTGTASDCYYGQVYYYSWYEFYPSPSYITPVAVHPGDTITASVHYSSVTHNFTTTIEDVTTGHSYTSPSTYVPGAERSSAEWIAESAYFDGFLALTHVTPASFSGGEATIHGDTHTISGWAPNEYWLLMVDYNFGMNQETNVATPGTETLAYAKAQPSGLSTSGTSFDVSWLSSGP